jgi:hypothetical protein
VLDISKTALSLAQSGLGKSAERITWIAADLLAWRPRRYLVWHDRAFLHFFVDADDRRACVNTLYEALVPGGYAIIASFAPAGPDRGSELPVHRSARMTSSTFSAASSALSRAAFRSRRPPRTGMPFTWVTARRSSRRRAERRRAQPLTDPT